MKTAKSARTKSTARKNEVIRYLVLSITWDRGWSMYEVVGAQAATANLATNTGVCATFNLTEDEVKQMLAHFELKRSLDSASSLHRSHYLS